ncbi:MAG TPA: hypothetical protein VD968_20030, partial [Pyrinomonadaceae bacterium]|nr:hypothetical protein [Pyrinomonadaceae bacterium]
MLYPRSGLRRQTKRASVALAFTLALTVISALPPPRAARAQEGSAPIPVIAPGSAFRQTNLVADWPGVARVQDPLLVNPWGISMTTTSPFWVANAGTSTS